MKTFLNENLKDKELKFSLEEYKRVNQGEQKQRDSLEK